MKMRKEEFSLQESGRKGVNYLLVSGADPLCGKEFLRVSQPHFQFSAATDYALGFNNRLQKRGKLLLLFNALRVTIDFLNARKRSLKF